jgi:predicted O-methyltransferase YrrM
MNSLKTMGLELKNIPAAFQFLRYKLVSSNSHHLHSPFVFDLYNNVIKDENPFYIFNLIESVRARMLLSDDEITVHDLGTGGDRSSHKKLSLSTIAKHSVKPAKYGQLLFRLVNKFHPEYIVELGTSLGITTMYLAAPHSDSKVITIEGCEETAAIAKKNFQLSRLKNIQQITGEFGECLPEALAQIPRTDFVFFDGNHRKEATLAYFQLCLAKHQEHSVFVFDDIHWSGEMNEAWKIIQQHEDVTLTIDLFALGIVFFRTGFPKQHFILKY